MKRDIYLNKLIRKKHNGMVKVITGIRRSGKSYLLFNLFYRHLLSEGIEEDHIIRLNLEDVPSKPYRDAESLYHYLKDRIRDNGMHYILLDEVQYVRGFEEVLNTLVNMDNVDPYVTGSNAKFLSKDVITEFRGRGDQVHIYPLTFSEFAEGTGVEPNEAAWRTYTMFGGLPKVAETPDEEDKISYLRSLYKITYLTDLLDRNKIQTPTEFSELVEYLASSIGSFTNPKKLSDTFKSVKNVTIRPETIRSYLDFLEDAFLLSRVSRYDVKGKRYFNTPMKYYFTDIGIRNERLNFREYEESHIMENIIYNELTVRGYSVDVGMVSSVSRSIDGRRTEKQLEVDFVCNRMSSKLYIQSALTLAETGKREQEEASLIRTGDFFRKIIITKTEPTHYETNGILILNLFDFLLDPHSLEKY